MLRAQTSHIHAHDGMIVDGKLQVSDVLGTVVFDHAEPLRLLAEAGFAGYCPVEVIYKRGSGDQADAVLGQFGEGLRALI